MTNLWQDVRYGCRMLLKNPGFTLVAVISLALGIGANTTVFTGAKGLLLTPLPGVERADELVMMHEVLTGAGGRDISNSYPNYADFRDRNEVFSDLAAYSLSTFSLSGGSDGRPQRVWGQLVSGNFFDTLGVGARLGRTFSPEEDRTEGTHPVAVISDRLWRGSFGANPDIIGKEMLLNNRAFRVIGVAPPNFAGAYVGLSLDVWVPMAMQPLMSADGNRLTRRGHQWLQVVGRLKPGVSIEQARANVGSIARGLGQQYPRTNEEPRRFALYHLARPRWRAADPASRVHDPACRGGHRAFDRVRKRRQPVARARQRGVKSSAFARRSARVAREC